MPTTYTASPYFDDYNETKQFYRILFRPGRAVQARELTQLQTLIQAQIERFGKGIYKEGSFVTPPKETYDTNYTFVKLEASYNSVDADDVIANLEDSIVIGQTSGVRARVVNYTLATTAGDPPTIYVKYLDAGPNATESAFTDGEVIQNSAATISVQAIASSATGAGVAYSLGTSVIFAKGNFLYVEEQTLIVEKYTSVTDRSIGFLVTESVVDSDADESLLDPAVGTFNYFAAGADRYKISLTLEDRSLVAAASDDPNYIEVLRIQDSLIITKNIDPRFSVLGDTLARRTFDESGNYVVKPFEIELIEHLRSNNPANAIQRVTLTTDGLYPAANGGDGSLFVTKITPGKAYVKGYEVGNIPTRYLTLSKARDFANVNAGTVATQLSSYISVDGVYSLPAFDDIATVEIYDKYKSTASTSNGTKVGEAKARGFIYTTGDVEAKTAVFQLHVFDVTMEPGYNFERDAKMVYSDNTGIPDFAANVVPVLKELSGTITFTDASNVITGSGTRFSTELEVGDFFTFSNTTTTQTFEVFSITDDSTVQTVNFPVGNGAGFLYSLDTATISDRDKDTFIIEFPYEVIKSVDPDNTETTYTVKRQYTRTLSAANAVTITAGTNETFAPFSTDNYVAAATSGVKSGNLITLSSTIVTRGGSPTGSTVTFDFTTANDAADLTSQTVELYTTVNKTNSASIKKTKTLVENANVDFVSKAEAQSAILSLGKADGFRLKGVRLSNVAFGSSYTEAGSSNITARYTFDNGQKATYYDTASVKLKPGQAKPTNPIRVTFDYFTHGTGDYFSVDSYSGIDYEDIPEVTIGTKTYKLRDCLDFRPRINDAGTLFTGTGASTTEFIDPEIDYVTDYQYYLGRTDVIGIDENGILFSVNGISSLNPQEPVIQADLLPLFVLKQRPYVFNLSNDIDLKRIESKRYTMKDIGKIENRVKTLEYYTTLSLLERDAQQEQIQDELGFERFKQGFLVDSFTGHGVGDSIDNPDYSVSVNYKNKEASPLVYSKNFKLKEQSSSAAQRTSNNYVLTGPLITLPYTEVSFINNQFSSTTENLNPFNVAIYRGYLELDPPGDLWFDDTRVPDITVDQTGNYESLSSASLIKKDGRNIFGSINDIEQFRNGIPQDSDELPDNLKGLADLIGSISPATTSVTLSGKDVIKNVTVIPKMRDVAINFTAQGMRPNTRLYAYFDEIDVSAFCTANTASVVAAIANVVANPNNIDNFDTLGNAYSNAYVTALRTDTTGTISGFFRYSSSALNLSTGIKTFRLTNSPTNNRETEVTFAEQIFVTDGIQREISTEVLRPPPPPPPPPQNYDRGIVVQDTGPSEPPQPQSDLLTKIYQAAAARAPDPSGYAYYTEKYGANLERVKDDPKLREEAIARISEGFVVNKEKTGVVGSTSGSSYDVRVSKVLSAVKKVTG